MKAVPKAATDSFFKMLEIDIRIVPQKKVNFDLAITPMHHSRAGSKKLSFYKNLN
jgi:hypothetical protein